MNDQRALLSPFLHQFTMIVGDVNTGKTHLTQRILDVYCQIGEGGVAVVDLAPDIPPAFLKDDISGIGGRLRLPGNQRARYYHCSLHAPRIEGKNEEEAMALATQNAHRIESLFEQALAQKTDVLFVNDCSLYLQAGKVEKMLLWVRSARTAIVNGYHGKTLGRGILSSREREEMEVMMKHGDRVIRLTGEEPSFLRT